MGVIQHVMKDEYARLNEAKQGYENLIAKLPQGSKHIKKLRNGEYLYLSQHLKEGYKSHYIGPLNSPKAEDVLKKIEKRKRLMIQLKEIKQELKEVKKVLRGKL